jgi:predicted phage tail protein
LGATTTSNSVNITVGSPPTVSLTTPTNGTSFTATANVTVTANASASNGSINRVEFYQGSSLIGTSTASPYTISWNNVAAGSYTLKARAINNSGVSTDSSPVSITVNAPPAVSIATPANGASFTAPINIIITANATDSDGSVSHVDFYNGTTLIGTSTSSPYNYAWNNVSAGTYSITAKATDNLGAQTSSTVINITVTRRLRPLPIFDGL